MDRTISKKENLPLLSPRLRAIADMITAQNERIIDIGTDHAYLPIWLVGNNICSHAIASDVRSGPVARAKENINRYGMGEKIQINLGDGLTNVDLVGEDTVIIAGMGGLEIMKILDRNLPENLTLILQPQKSIPELRLWLTQNGFSFEDESVIRDRKHFYSIIRVKYIGDHNIKTQELDPLAAWLGPIILKNNLGSIKAPWWYLYLQDKKNTLAKAILGKPELKDLIIVINEMLADTSK